MTATRRTIPRQPRNRRRTPAAIAFAAALWAITCAVATATAQYMYIDTNANGVHDGGDLLNEGCATTLRIFLDTDSNRGGGLLTCNTGPGSVTLTSYMFALHADGGTVDWGTPVNQQTSMTQTLAAVSTSTELVAGFSGSAALSAGTYLLATVTVLPLTGSPVISFRAESTLGPDFGTMFGTGCSGQSCDHTYRLEVDWIDTEGVGPPVDATPPSVTAPATVGGEEGALFSFTVTAGDCEAIDYFTADLSALPGGNAIFTVSADHHTGTLTWTPGSDDEGVYPVTFIAGNAKIGTATTMIQVVNRTNLIPYRAAEYRFIQLPPLLPFPPGIESPSYDDGGYPILPAPFGDTMCPGIKPATHWFTSTRMVVRKWFSPGGQVSGAKLRFLIDNEATIFINETQVASVSRGGCPYQDRDIVDLPGSLLNPDSNLVVALCTDNEGWSSFDLSITATDVGPRVNAPSDVTILESHPLTVRVSVSDPEGHSIASLTADLTGLPPGHNAVFTPSGNLKTAVLTWTPMPADVRPEPYLVPVTATNALTGSRTIRITVTAGDTPPVVAAPSFISSDYTIPVDFTVTASDPESQMLDSLTADLSGLPPSGAATFTTSAGSDSGSFHWAPSIADVSPTPYVVTFTAWNTFSGSAQTSILVTNDDRAPIVSAPDTATVNEGSLVSIEVGAADPDGDPITSLGVDTSALPAGNDSDLEVAPDHLAATFTWTPTFDDAGAPPYPVVFIATNASSDSATTLITVYSVDRRPSVTAPATVTGAPASPISFGVTAGDPDGNTIDSLVAQSVPPGASFTADPGNASGTFSWTPTSGDLCTQWTVTFIAANLLADTAATKITVSSGACAPVVTAPAALSALASVALAIDVSAADPDGDALSTLTADFSGLPAGNNATFGPTAPDRSAGRFTWTPTAYTEGTFPVTFTATNSLSGSATTQISVTPSAGYLTRRASISSQGIEGNSSSYNGRISANGGYVVFHSNASNLVTGDTNLQPDVFRRDLIGRTTERASLGNAGVEPNGPCVDPYVSADGRFVAFTSTASNLVPGDLNSAQDVFLRDMQTGTTERISLTDGGLESNGPSFASGVSGDGRYVVFCSDGSNLVSGDGNGATDVFVRDRVSATTLLLSRATDGTQGNARSCENSAGAISTDGRFVTFPSIATNLVPDDANGRNDVFVRDLVAGTTEIVSRSSLEEPSNQLSAWPAISGDGRYVAFSSIGSNLVPADGNGTWDVFVRDRTLGVTDRVTVNSSEVEANRNSGYAAVANAGPAVAFFSYGSNLVSGDTNGIADIFLRDQALGGTERVSVSGTNQEAAGPDAHVGVVSTSGDGRFVVFCMAATNLVPGDGNGAIDVFVRDRQQTANSVGAQPATLQRRALLAHPNPSQRGVTLRFFASRRPTAPLRIYDVRGRLVREVSTPPGGAMPIQYRWDGLDARGRAVSAGVYLAVAMDGATTVSRKIVVVD